MLIPRLTREHLADLRLTHGDIQQPEYDRRKLRPGLVHIGSGAFHRGHQAQFTDDLLNAGLDDRFITGINLHPPLIGDVLGAQGGLYSLSLRDSAQATTSIIGSLGPVLEGDGAIRNALEILADPQTRVVTLTITEKGYCHIPARGQLNEHHPQIVADMANSAAPISVPGVLVEALRRRRATQSGAMTLLSCDNIPANGVTLANVVLQMARAQDIGLARWIEDHVHFPSSMVDRIMPATRLRDIEWAQARLGCRDEAAVFGEPFRQWVIEDDFGPGFPRWDAVGAEYVSDVVAHEQIKMRVLNAAQSAMSFIGCLIGLPTTRADTGHAMLRSFVERMLLEETGPTLPNLPGMDWRAYVVTTFQRLANPEIHHTNHQIATDGSQKIIQRLLAPLAECLATGRQAPRLTAAVGAWIAYLAAGAPIFGARWVPQDPYAERIAHMAQACGNDMARLVGEVAGISEIFDPALASRAEFCAMLASSVSGWLSASPEAFLAGLADA